MQKMNKTECLFVTVTYYDSPVSKYLSAVSISKNE